MARQAEVKIDETKFSGTKNVAARPAKNEKTGKDQKAREAFTAKIPVNAQELIAGFGGSLDNILKWITPRLVSVQAPMSAITDNAALLKLADSIFDVAKRNGKPVSRETATERAKIALGL